MITADYSNGVWTNTQAKYKSGYTGVSLSSISSNTNKNLWNTGGMSNMQVASSTGSAGYRVDVVQSTNSINTLMSIKLQ